MLKDPSAVVATIPREIKEELRKLAHKNKRSLSMEVAWVLERYVKSQEDDGA